MTISTPMQDPSNKTYEKALEMSSKVTPCNPPLSTKFKAGAESILVSAQTHSAIQAVDTLNFSHMDIKFASGNAKSSS